MTQSVELVLDAEADRAVRAEWRALAQAGLPTAERTVPSPSHRPHVTLLAQDALPDGAEAGLAEAVAGLGLTVPLGAVMLFGPRRGSYVLVRAVVVSAALLELQRRVADVGGAGPDGQFGAGRWTPHVTLARRVRADQVGPSLAVLGAADGVEAHITECRRWDSDAKRAWTLGR